ncbi:hypothetical protein JMUB3933_1917 [Leptotrichia wadei]|uniref:TIR domain-containing protein n=1 Tax=Leptotrichia wadei TaxID=157687 RepID=A0A510KCF2_9FUSO|nr:toll/interleukin-1 receptor domain-containing protein [Leptotrichia wadei]BBM48401.1 hypothetical protein JMUB3933_1917 [Leptotrichia wadei]
MIFISHNYKDKEIIEPLANRLSDVYGKDAIFYDSWSIQPGDGIIDKMNKGLSSINYFFFFVSDNSLKSDMVKLEWQNALIKSLSSDTKFIPVRLDRSEMPAILKQILYLDVFSNGFETVLRQMIDVIDGNNTYHGEKRTYENVNSKIKVLNKNEIEIEILAITYMEPICKYIILTLNGEEELKVECPGEVMFEQGFLKEIEIEKNFVKEIVNGIMISLHRPLTPGFPMRIIIKSDTEIIFKGIMKAISEGKFVGIPTELIQK